MTTKPEHRLSHWCLVVCDRIILVDGPAWWTAVETGTMMLKDGTEEEKKRTRAAIENSRRYQGIKPHALDVCVYQRPVQAWIELKIAGNLDQAMKKLTVGETQTIEALNRNHMPNAVAWSIASFYAALQRFGFRLHPNSDNIVREIEERYAAACREAVVKAAGPKKPRASPKAGPRYTASAGAVRRARRAGVLL